MVRPTQAKQRMLTSTPKAGTKPPQQLPHLPSTPSGKVISSSSKKRRRSSMYHTKKARKAKDTTVRKHRFHPGMRALKEIRHYQKTWGTLIPKLPFSRLVREVLAQYSRDYRIQSLALEALQEASEVYITTMLERANLCSIHARRVTLMPPDIKLVRRITEEL